ncbi:hypothetical protein ACFCP7_22505 [Paenibacillus elgii]
MDPQFQFESWYFECRKLNYLMKLRKHRFPTESLCYNVYENIKDVVDHTVTAGEPMWMYESKGLVGDFSWVPLERQQAEYTDPEEVTELLLDMKVPKAALLWVYRDRLDYAPPDGVLKPDMLHSLYVNGVKETESGCQFHIHDTFPEYIGWVEARKVCASMEGMPAELQSVEFLDYRMDRPLFLDRDRLWQAFTSDIARTQNEASAYARLWDGQTNWSELYDDFATACFYHSEIWTFLAGSRYMTKCFLEWVGYEGEATALLQNYAHQASILRSAYMKAMLTGKAPGESAYRRMQEIAEADEKAFTALKACSAVGRGTF